MEAGLILALAAGIGAALVVAGLASWFYRPEKRPPATPSGSARFVFSGRDAIDAPPWAQAVIDAEFPAAPDNWWAFSHFFSDRFPQIADTDPQNVLATQTIPAFDFDDCGRMVLEPGANWLTVTLEDVAADPLDHHLRRHLTRRLDEKNALLDASPYPIWKSTDDGTIMWANSAYRELEGKAARNETGDRLFQIDCVAAKDKTSTRTKLAIPDMEPLWFDVRSIRHDQFWHHFALDMNAAVKAETAQRNFVQTLTKTFAQLSIGLAIFDRNRQLALFNPALIDLTSLPADFLSARPDLHSFFDRLRDKRMMPEPKNYGSWRDELTTLIEAARHGQYTETWTLPNGLTYRISGRPHPDGAVAFLFEDISAEISLTRRFRIELEHGQSILDTVDEAICVFSPLGLLSTTNLAYEKLWGAAKPNDFGELNANRCTRIWQVECEPTPVWGEIRDFVTRYGERAEWDAVVRHIDGRELACRVVPLNGGSTLVGFRLVHDSILQTAIMAELPD